MLVNVKHLMHKTAVLVCGVELRVKTCSGTATGLIARVLRLCLGRGLELQKVIEAEKKCFVGRLFKKMNSMVARLLRRLLVLVGALSVPVPDLSTMSTSCALLQRGDAHFVGAFKATVLRRWSLPRTVAGTTSISSGQVLGLLCLVHRHKAALLHRMLAHHCREDLFRLVLVERAIVILPGLISRDLAVELLNRAQEDLDAFVWSVSVEVLVVLSRCLGLDGVVGIGNGLLLDLALLSGLAKVKVGLVNPHPLLHILLA